MSFYEIKDPDEMIELFNYYHAEGRLKSEITKLVGSIVIEDRVELRNFLNYQLNHEQEEAKDHLVINSKGVSKKTSETTETSQKTPRPDRDYQAWTTTEIERLGEMLEERLTPDVIALRFGRTTKAIKNKASRTYGIDFSEAQQKWYKVKKPEQGA